MALQTKFNDPSISGEASVSSANCGHQPPSGDRHNNNSDSGQQAGVKRKRDLPEMPDPDAEVIALSTKTLMATNRFVCEICNKGFKRDQNLQLHRRGHNLPWKLTSKETRDYRCDCGTLFNRRDSFITHRAVCDELAEGSARFTVNPQQGDPADAEKTGEQREGSPPSLKSPFHIEPCKAWLPRDHGSVFDASSSPIKLEGRTLFSESSPEPQLDSNKSQLSHKIQSTSKPLKRKAEQSPRTVFRTRSKVDILDDGYRWRKYGEKIMKGGNIRHYYRCTQSNCHVKKKVERDITDTGIVITTYGGKHNHECSVVPYIVNHPLLETQQGVLTEDKSGIPEDDMDQRSRPSDKLDASPTHCPISSGFTGPGAEIFDLSTTGLMATNIYAALSAWQRTTNDIAQGEDIKVPDLTIGNSAASSDSSSRLIDQLLNTKADKPDFDLGQLVAQIDAFLVNYDTQLRTENTIPEKLPDLPSLSEVSNFTDQVSKHVKQIANQVHK